MTFDEVIHLMLLLMPKYNRDLLECLCTFLKKISLEAERSELDGKAGNLMTTTNLATVIAPTIMYHIRDKEAHKETLYKKGFFFLSLL